MIDNELFARWLGLQAPWQPNRSVTERSTNGMHYQSLSQHSFALVIGVGQYLNPFFSDLPATVQDAHGIAAILRDPRRCHYPPANVQVITGAEATFAGISTALERLSQSADSDSTVLIYFSGHGGRVRQDGHWQAYLCPREADPDQLDQTAISGDRFSEMLAAIPARRKAVFLDSCHAGGVVELKAPDDTVIWKAGLPESYYEMLTQGSGSVVIASSKEDQVSYVQGELSLFTHHLLQALGGKAAVRGDGLIHVLDVFHYISEAVQRDQPRQVPVLAAKDLDLNFAIALDIGGKTIGAPTTPPQIVAIREQIIRDPLAGGKALSDYLASRQEWASRRTEVDLKRSELEQTEHELMLFGPDPSRQATKNRSTFFLLQVCLELERVTLEQQDTEDESKASVTLHDAAVRVDPRRSLGRVPLPVWLFLGGMLVACTLALLFPSALCCFVRQIIRPDLYLVDLLVFLVAVVVAGAAARLLSPRAREMSLSFLGGLALVFAAFLVMRLPSLPECCSPTATPMPTPAAACEEQVVTFDFESMSNEGWDVRWEGDVRLGESAMPDDGHYCGSGHWSLAFDYQLRASPPSDKAQVKYQAEHLGLAQQLSAWIYAPANAPGDLQASCFVLEDNTAGTWPGKPEWPWYQTGYTPLEPGEWTLVRCLSSDFTASYAGGHYEAPLLVGFELTRAGKGVHQGTVYLDKVVLR